MVTHMVEWEIGAVSRRVGLYAIVLWLFSDKGAGGGGGLGQDEK